MPSSWVAEILSVIPCTSAFKSYLDPAQPNLALPNRPIGGLQGPPITQWYGENVSNHHLLAIWSSLFFSVSSFSNGCAKSIQQIRCWMQLCILQNTTPRFVCVSFHFTLVVLASSPITSLFLKQGSCQCFITLSREWKQRFAKWHLS